MRFLRNGDQITIVRNIITSSGLGAALFQVVDPNSGNVTPNWTVAANQPIVQISARSAAVTHAEPLYVKLSVVPSKANLTSEISRGEPAAERALI